jgi:hypothetical protein
LIDDHSVDLAVELAKHHFAGIKPGEDIRESFLMRCHSDKNQGLTDVIGWHRPDLSRLKKGGVSPQTSVVEHREIAGVEL